MAQLKDLIVNGASRLIGLLTATDINATNSLKKGGVNVSLEGHTHSDYVNQNAFSNIKVGSTTIAADIATDTVELVAGSNITLTPDATNDKVTIAATDTTYTAATGAPPNISTTSAVGTSTNYARQDHTHAITLASGDSNGQIKIAGSNVSVKGLGTAAYTSSGSYSTATNWTNGTGTGSVQLAGTASGTYSVAEGDGTVANHKSQHAFGEFNTEDVNSNGSTSRGTYVEMVGNGTSATNRSNARTLDWEGNEVLSGSMTVGAKAKLQYNSTTEALDFIFV